LVAHRGILQDAQINANDGQDIAWLGLERQGEGRWSFELTGPLTRFDGKLYGGTGIAVSVATMEAESGRGAVYNAVQFVGSADTGDRIDCHVEALATGRRTTQLRFTATVADRVVLVAIGATGEDRTGLLSAQFGEMPDVPLPDETGTWKPNVPFPIRLDVPSWLNICELRDVPGPRHLLWARMKDMPLTRASLGFLADMVPSAVVRAAGHVGGGTSLDNAMRFGPAPETDWMLIDFDPYQVSGGYAHGGARLWSSEGTLLGVASQTATMFTFPPSA
jgi:acyl-CoA thioesterase